MEYLDYCPYNKECRIAAVGVIPFGVQDSTTPLIKIFVANEDKLTYK